MWFLGLIAGLTVFFFVARWLVSAGIVAFILIVILSIAGPNLFGQPVKVLSYQELVDYPVSCDKADEQLAYLKQMQSSLNLAKDPDDLNENDRFYNSRLKSTIWWYAYRCDKS